MLARTSKSGTSTGTVTPRSPIPSASGLSVQGLREAIRRVERGIEADLLYAGDAPMMDAESTPLFAKSTSSEPYEAASRLRLSDSQLRMAQWLNALPISKYVTWYPEVPNSHAVIIVR
jgi:hypothetical protein